MDYFAKTMHKALEKGSSRIIFSADSADWNEIEHVLKSNKGRFAAIKVHPEHALIWGLSHKKTTEKIKRLGKVPVILDAKLADIDKSNQMKTEYYLRQGYDAIICHGFPGDVSVKAASDVAKKMGKGLLVIASMTSQNNLFSDSDITKIVKMARDLGTSGVIAPGNNYAALEKIRKMLGRKQLILSPGIGAQGGDMTKALKYADFIISGRSILNSQKR